MEIDSADEKDFGSSRQIIEETKGTLPVCKAAIISTRTNCRDVQLFSLLLARKKRLYENSFFWLNNRMGKKKKRVVLLRFGLRRHDSLAGKMEHYCHFFSAALRSFWCVCDFFMIAFGFAL